MLQLLKYAHAASAPEAATVGLHAGTGPVVTLVLVVLLVMSVLTWAIVAYKVWRRRLIGVAEAQFLEAFYRSRGLRKIYNAAKDAELSGAAQLFTAAYDEMEALKEHSANLQRLGVDGMTRLIERALDRAALDVRVLRERYLTFLATTASAAPFIGLFGTVWGIMDAFGEIGRMGSASLAVVAPGISEALIATAVGLLAAIPAAWFYNFQQRAIDEESAALAGFRLELLNLLEAYVFPDLLAGREPGESTQDGDGIFDRTEESHF